MKAITVAAPGGLDRLNLVERPDPGSPAAGEIRVRLHANSINFHDYAVARGFLASADGRIPMADGANGLRPVIDRTFALEGLAGRSAWSSKAFRWSADRGSCQMRRIPDDGL